MLLLLGPQGHPSTPGVHGGGEGLSAGLYCHTADEGRGKVSHAQRQPRGCLTCAPSTGSAPLSYPEKVQDPLSQVLQLVKGSVLPPAGSSRTKPWRPLGLMVDGHS